MFTGRLVSAAVLGAVATLVPVALADHPLMRFVFDTDVTGGVSGYIAFHYYGEDRGGSDVEVQLKLDRFDTKALKAFDGNCTADKISEFTWHIHTKWTQPKDFEIGSTKLGQCSKAAMGNHYDPYKICGPASEYIDTPACQAKVKNYKCTPDEYKKNFAACEAGDLSGKFGNIKPDSNGEFIMSWPDARFPFPSEATADWSIVIHAVCGKATPRVACSHGYMSTSKRVINTKDDSYGANDQTVISVGKLKVRVHAHNN